MRCPWAGRRRADARVVPTPQSGTRGRTQWLQLAAFSETHQARALQRSDDAMGPQTYRVDLFAVGFPMLTIPRGRWLRRC